MGLEYTPHPRLLNEQGTDMTTVTVKVHFEAAHRLHNPAKPDDWNCRVYGKCNNPHGHGHNYVLEVSVEGVPDPETGYLIDMKDLKDLIRRTVVADVDHRHLNLEVEWLAGIIPTSENLARVFFERIEPELPDGVRLAAVTLHETERNAATYRQ
jgi:6-pyruvoyltetrahydropterin/6-carboxytetrahydropterin synthase